MQQGGLGTKAGWALEQVIQDKEGMTCVLCRSRVGNKYKYMDLYTLE